MSTILIKTFNLIFTYTTHFKNMLNNKFLLNNRCSTFIEKFLMLIVTLFLATFSNAQFEATHLDVNKLDVNKSTQSILPATVVKALFQTKIPPQNISVTVDRLSDGQRIIDYQSKKTMAPASLIKLVTSFVGLTMLGQNFQWQTPVFIDGKIKNNTLYGNLYIKGYGDPQLVPELLEQLVADIQLAGIKHIQGNIVLEKSYFASETRDALPLDDDTHAPYNVGPDALLYAYKSVLFTLTPNPNGQVDISPLPHIRQVQIDNQLQTSAGKCNVATIKSTLTPIIKTLSDGRIVVTFKGILPIDCGPQVVKQAFSNHSQFFVGGFLAIWHQYGGTFSGGINESAIPHSAQLIATHRSRPLADIVADMNKFSNNVIARNLFLTLGAIGNKPPADLQESFKVVKKWLSKQHIDVRNLIIDNGSGLSRQSRLNSNQLNALLRAAYKSPIFGTFIHSLPIACKDGSMKKRLCQSVAAEKAFIKTGTLNNVRSISGYVQSNNNDLYAVTSIINDKNAENAELVHDNLIKWLAR